MIIPVFGLGHKISQVILAGTLTGVQGDIRCKVVTEGSGVFLLFVH